jgi:hypothetical protein
MSPKHRQLASSRSQHLIITYFWTKPSSLCQIQLSPCQKDPHQVFTPQDVHLERTHTTPLKHSMLSIKGSLHTTTQVVVVVVEAHFQP